MKPEDIADYARYEIDQAAGGSYDELLNRIPVRLNGLRVLDLAAGPGTWTRLFAEAGASMAVWQDRSGKFMALAREHLEGIGGTEMVLADMAALPFGCDTFDVVFCRVSLHHSRSEARTIREIARVLRPGGVAALVTNRVGRVSRKVPFGWKKPLHYLTPLAAALTGRPVGPRLWNIEWLLRRRLAASGLEIEEWDRSSPESVISFSRKGA